MVTLRGSSTPRHSLVVASMPYWNIDHDTSAVLGHEHAVNEASPWMYGLSGSGEIDPQYGAGQAAAVAADIPRLRAAGKLIVPSIANITGGKWAYQPVARMLHSPSCGRRRCRDRGLVQQNQYAGIDIDYEELHAADRRRSPVRHRAGQGPARERQGAVGRGVRPDHQRGARPAQRVPGLRGARPAADQVRIMGYNYHWETSAPGPTAPIGWVRGVLSYATRQMPASKVVLGVPLFGYDWDGNARRRQSAGCTRCGCPASTTRLPSTARPARRPSSATGRGRPRTPCGSRTPRARRRSSRPSRAPDRRRLPVDVRL